ncbi:ras-domain-containing protein [Calocera cornea HHB12733]|uniref:Ras-domain-containing protein n=1 Tax=Calocera cornea HHB12733 TaxID=1353952 RepID=A0A165CHA1_9BASI|nr:ras-domain-containing protein [Calocera cornea HHB12733]
MSGQESWKVALFGDGAVGKTAIAVKFTRGTFLETYDPTIEDSYRVHASFQGKPAFLEIVDTAGQDDYATLRDQWLHSDSFSEGDAYILVYAVSSRKSFMRVKAMEKAIIRARSKSVHVYPVSILVGNKYDLTDQAGGREVGAQEAYELAQQFGCHFIETSAKSGYNIQKMFETLVVALRNRHAGRPSTAPPGTIWDRSVPVSPTNGQSPSSFRFPPTQSPPMPYSAGPSDPYASRSRQGSTPTLRPSASAYPLPRSPSLHGNAPPTTGPGAKQLRGRSSTSALRSPTDSTAPPPVPPLPVSARSMGGPNAPPGGGRAKMRVSDKTAAKMQKSATKEAERREKSRFNGKGGVLGGSSKQGGAGDKDGKCIIC